MNKVWRLYKVRIIFQIMLALIAGWSLTASLYFYLESASVLTRGDALRTIGILGMLSACVLFFIAAQFMVEVEGMPRFKLASIAEDEQSYTIGNNPRDWTIDPLDNQINFGAGISGIIGEDD